MLMPLGNIFVISAPSGAGKSSLVKALCNLDSYISVSISHTTRKKRDGERNGIDYFFVNTTEFEQMLTAKKFIEHACVYDNYYGTSTEMIETFTKQGQDIILEIDHQGAFQIQKIFPDATLIYILPPGENELKSRLINRNTDSIDTIKHRLRLAKSDISHAKKFDFAVINNDFDTALHDIYSIIRTQRLIASNVLKNYVF